MSHTLAQYKNSLGGMLSGLDLNDVTNLNGAIERAARNLIQRAKIPEGQAKASITLYDSVYDYAAPSGIWGSEIVDIRPQGAARWLYDYDQKVTPAQFDRQKAWLPSGYMLTSEYDASRNPILRIAQRKATAAIILDDMSVTTGWTASGNASSLTEDNTVYYKAPSSLRFNLASAGSQGLLAKTITAQDLTTYRGVGVAFLAVKFPSASAITSVRLRIGSSSSNYYEVTNTTGFTAAFQANAWFLIPFDLSGATTTGSPTITAMNYVQIAVNYDGTALNNVYVGNLFICLPSPHEVIYQTAQVFQSGTTLGSAITNDNDTIILNDSAYNLFLHEGCLEIELQQSGGRSTALSMQFEKKLFDPINGLYTLYRYDNPSQTLKTIGNYLND